MNEQNENTKDILMDTVVAKLNQQDEKSQLQEGRISVIEGKLSDNSKLNTESERQSKLANGKVQELIKRLDNLLVILSKPSQSEVLHHHHFPVILWATAGLFLALCLVSTGWFMTGQKAEQFKANDIKYRYLKVFLDSTATDYLFRLDSTYAAHPDSFQTTVVNRERLKERRLELLGQFNSVDSQFKAGQSGAGERKKVSR